MGKATYVVIAIMVGLVTVVIAAISWVSGSWVPLIGTGIGFGIAVLIIAVEIPLLNWATKKWGDG